MFNERHGNEIWVDAKMSKEYIVKTTQDFDSSLDDIINLLESVNPRSTKFIYQEIMQKFDTIQIFPRMYPLLKSNPETRKMTVWKYNIFYEINRNIIYILDIIHQKSKYLNNQD